MAAGLAVCEDIFHPSQFNWLVYKASSGGLGTPEGDARIAYYSVSGFPTGVFDGSTFIVGAPADAVDGRYYIPVIEDNNAESVPLAMAVSDYSFEQGTAFAEVKLRLFGDLANINSSFIRIVVVEDDVLFSGTRYDNVVRRILADQPLTISQDGQEQTVNLPIPMSGGWNVDNLWLIAFVQRDTDKYMFNSTSSRVGEFAVVADVDGPQQMVAEGESITFGTFNMLNVGFSADTFDVSLDLSALPDGWDAYMTYEGEDLTEVEIPLGMFEASQLAVSMQTGDTGSGRVVLEVFSQGAGEVVASVVFNGLAGGTDFLVVADDNGAGHAYDAYAPALSAVDKTYAVWERSLQTLESSDLMDYDAVIWTSGSNNETLVASDRTALDAYLAAGGRLILAGEDLLESLQIQGGSAALWMQLRLRFSLMSGNSGNLQIVGEDDDPIGDGLNFTLTGGDPDVVSLISGQPVEVSMTYGNGNAAVVRTVYNDYKVVTVPFGLERVPGQGDRNTLLQRALQWLDVLGTTSVSDLPGAALVLHQNAPNPFNPSTEIAFATAQPGAVRLEIFNARGQLVQVLVDEVLASGSHTVTWDGRTTGGEQAASGVYFYRLTRDGEQLTRKMSLVK